ncbi:hypothetical protein [Mycolicibacterium fallax]|uniref:Uncharacterized protein n=1 Tax=Mycolicibacterium fallax TaxID=1793 RepID=A0A1X1RMR0_MYCFA|nr:hypothetical protein [Mycolicibacterium fallax]ORV09682.1 hypothetical protein AWC04_01315 [Mycolicibacterium fallax]
MTSRRPASSTPGRRGRPHLGDRVVVTAALTPSDLIVVDGIRGSLPRSTFINELLAEHVGRTDLLAGPIQLALVDATTPQRRGQLLAQVRTRPVDGRVLYATVRVHPDVHAEIERLRHDADLPQSTYTAEVVRERLGIAAPRPRAEGLPLAM